MRTLNCMDFSSEGLLNIHKILCGVHTYQDGEDHYCLQCVKDGSCPNNYSYSYIMQEDE